MEKINRKQHSKFIINSAILIFFFYGLLAAFSKLYLTTIIPFWFDSRILYLPIVLGFIGLSWGIYNLTYDPVIVWEKGKIATFTIISGSGVLFAAQLILILGQWIIDLSIFYIGNILLILSCLTLAVGFFFFYQQLVSLFIKKLVPRNPLPLISIAFLTQTVTYILYFTSFIVTFYNSESLIINILNYIGMGISGVFLVLLALGFYQLFPAFRAFPALGDYLEEQVIAKSKSKQKSSAKTKSK